MNVLEVVEETCHRLGYDAPSTLVGNTDRLARQFLKLFQEGGRANRTLFRWPQCNKDYSFALQSGVDAYSIPDDFDYVVKDTHWDRSQHWPMRGPFSPEEWQYQKHGIQAASPCLEYRVSGPIQNKLRLLPTPAASDAGRLLGYEYQSLNWLRPATLPAWAPSTAYTTANYVQNNGHIYKCASNGTSAASGSGPSHVTGTAADGSTSWTFTVYEKVLADTDVPLLKDELLVLELKWRVRRALRVDYEDEMGEAEDAWKGEASAFRGSRRINLAGCRRGVHLIGYENIKEGSWEV